MCTMALINKSKLSAYTLSLGYIQRIEKHSIRLDLYREWSSYIVKAYDFDAHREISFTLWNTLTEARREFSRLRHSLFGTGREK